MQNDPEKISSNYNELVGDPTSTIPQLDGTYRIQLDQYQDEVSAKEIVRVGNELVNNKIDEILGVDNKLTDKDTAKPTVSFSHIENPLNTLGYFSPKNNTCLDVTYTAPLGVEYCGECCSTLASNNFAVFQSSHESQVFYSTLCQNCDYIF